MKSLTSFMAIACMMLLFEGGCAKKQEVRTNGKLSDETFTKMLIGTWWKEDELENIIVYGETTYTIDGSATGFVTAYKKTMFGKGPELQQATFSNKWKIENGILITHDPSSIPKIFPNSHIIKDKIIEMDNEKVVYLALSDNTVFYRLKKK